jgi:hypothetical protein
MTRTLKAGFVLPLLLMIGLASCTPPPTFGGGNPTLPPAGCYKADLAGGTDGSFSGHIEIFNLTGYYSTDGTCRQAFVKLSAVAASNVGDADTKCQALLGGTHQSNGPTGDLSLYVAALKGLWECDDSTPI